MAVSCTITKHPLIRHCYVVRLRGRVAQGGGPPGLVYPTFYSKLYYDLRGVLAHATTADRTESTGLWAVDATLTGFTLCAAPRSTRSGAAPDGSAIHHAAAE